MAAKEYLAFIVEQIYSTVVPAVDGDCLPVTRVMNMMCADDNGFHICQQKTSKNIPVFLETGMFCYDSDTPP